MDMNKDAFGLIPRGMKFTSAEVETETESRTTIHLIHERESFWVYESATEVNWDPDDRDLTFKNASGKDVLIHVADDVTVVMEDE